MNPLHLKFATLLAAFAGIASPAHGQTEPPVTIHIDATTQGTRLRPVWPYFGYDEANYTTDPEATDLLRTLAATQATPVRVRTHFLFNTGDGTPQLKWGSTNIYTEDATGEPVYDYSIIDQIIDAQIDSGVFPLFELGFMPKALSAQPEPYENSSTFVLDGGAFYPPSDYDKWAGLVSAYAERAKKRYAGTQTNWIWELWNEPDIAYFQGTVDEYAKLYDYTEAALHAALPDALLAGPAIARPNESFLAEFLSHCESGTNAVTGNVGTRLDVVTFHAKGGTTLVDGDVRMDLGNQLSLHRAGFAAVLGTDTFKSTPIIISEADPDGCAACSAITARHFRYRNSPAYGAYEVAMMKRSVELAENMGVNLEGLLTWAFTFPGSPYFAGYRALASNGISMPVLNAFKMLGQLQGNRLPLASSGALALEDIISDSVRESADIDGMAAVDGTVIRVLVWNYHDDLVEAARAQVHVDLDLPQKFESWAQVDHQRVDEEHGDAFSVWEAQGKPETPTDQQLNELHAAMDAVEFMPTEVIEVQGGKVSLDFDLPRHGVSLITLRPTTAPKESSAEPDSTGCSCRTSPTKQSDPGKTFILLLALSLTRRLRTARPSATAPGYARRPELN